MRILKVLKICTQVRAEGAVERPAGAARGGEVVKEQRGVVEITKQMGLMEKKISSFAVKSERAELACKVDTQRKAMENSLLIHELNELRYQSGICDPGSGW